MYIMEVNEVFFLDVGEYVVRVFNVMGIVEFKCIVRVIKKLVRRVGFVFIYICYRKLEVKGNRNYFFFYFDIYLMEFMFLIFIF